MLNICLLMITCDNIYSLPFCLQSVSKYINSWLVIDLNSTDKSDNYVKQYFKNININGSLYHIPFIDYENTKKIALYLTKFSSADYFLIIDPTDVIENLILPTELTADAYQLMYQPYQDYRTILIVSHLEVKSVEKLEGSYESRISDKFPKYSSTVFDDFFLYLRYFHNYKFMANKDSMKYDIKQSYVDLLSLKEELTI